MTHRYSRIISTEVAKVLKQKSILLLGPRQVGKCTLLKSLEPTLQINLSDEAVYQNHIKDPDLLRRKVLGLKNHRSILIDEIQRIPSLLNTIQSLIDDHSQLRFAITGSSARKLKRGQANLLPGRVISRTLAPLTFWELESEWTDEHLKKSLTTGNLPGVFSSDLGLEIIESYAKIYLREEIQAEALTKDLGDYSRFLDLAAELSGQYLNYSTISSESEINKEKIRRYVEILMDTLLIRRVDSFIQVQSNRKARQKDKFYFFDLGVRNAILGKLQSHLTATETGPLFESWIILQVLALRDYLFPQWKIQTYRDDRHLEVDLIIETDSHLHICEIKFQKKYRNEFEQGLIEFSTILKSKKKVKKYVIYCGEEMQKSTSGTAIIPYQQFLKFIKEDLR